MWRYTHLTVNLGSSAGKEKSDFLAEIDMMKKIAEGYNNHIVNIVGCVTLQEPLCLITEFIPFGDLLSYLKYQRKKVIASHRMPGYEGKGGTRALEIIILYCALPCFLGTCSLVSLVFKGSMLVVFPEFQLPT